MKTLLLAISILSFTGFSQQVDLVTPLSDSLIETSGLIFLNDRLITHNDSGGEHALYEIDTTSGSISRTVIIDNVTNIDWEDVCYDDTHIYIADFGNNSGSRTNLRVYRVSISDYLNTPNDTISADTILFDYSDQTDFTPTSLSTNYDAEALISWNDSLYIFTKNWGNQWTNVYALPKNPGNYSLPRIDSIDVQGFITGASFNVDSNSIILSGYTFTYPFVVELKDLTSSQFSSATIERTQVQLPGGYSYQLEGIAPIDGTSYYISTEQSFSGSSGLFRFNLGTLGLSSSDAKVEHTIYPNPATDYLFMDFSGYIRTEIYSVNGKRVLSTKQKVINLSEFSKGNYLVILIDDKGRPAVQERLIIH
ncbi:MAG: T9SS type A sorting domain-containing protein [Crocinitomicaceae bacterium]